MSEDERADEDEPSGVDYRQVSFVLVAIIGLAMAAFLAPPVPEQTQEDGDNPDASTDLIGAIARILEYLFDFPGGEGEPACQILLNPEPVPGDDVTVTVRDENRPVTDAVVWFNDERIGRTDEDGQVTGEVPYTRQLEIRVDAPSLSGCRATTGTDRPFGSVSKESAHGRALSVSVSGAGPTLATATAPDSPFASASGRPTQADRHPLAFAQDDNGSATYPIRGMMTIEALGRPFPEETVTIDAEIRGVPVSNATVEVAGKEVGRTDESGQLQIEIPDQDEVSVTVSKGEFSQTKTIDALKLQPALESESILLVPQGDATVVASRADEQVEDAVVRVDGERVGQTNSLGERAVVLPLDPRAEVTVSTDRQDASVSLFDIYWLPAVFALTFVSVLSGGAYRLVGWPGTLAVVGVSIAVLTTLLAEAYLGQTAGVLTLAGYAVLGLVVGLYLRRSRAADAASEATGLLARLLEWIATTALRLVAGIEPLLDRLGDLRRRLVAWLRSLPRSTSALLRRFTDWLAMLPDRIADFIDRLSLSPRAAGIGLLVLLLPVGGYLIGGPRGIGLAILVLLVAGAGWWYVGRESPEPDDADAAEELASSAGSTSTATTGRTTPETLRELWRAFARRVVPGRWRTRSPAEVGRAALRKGYPDRPVRELTETFREVEYGNRSLSDAVDERAREAYRALVDDGSDRDTGQGTDGPDTDAAATDGAKGRAEPKRVGSGREAGPIDEREPRGDQS